jgi:hypothetical protein
VTTIWQEEGGRWRAVSPTGFENEQALHDLVAEAPDLLPLAGAPRLAVVGREVPLSSGYPDLLAVELSGRLVVIEVKLAANAEARRAVIAQALGYAAALQGMTLEELEQGAVRAELARRGHESLAAAARAADQEDALDVEEFRSALAENLESGAFQIVLVLDDAPQELVRLAGYLERVTDGVLLDLVTVSAFEIGGRRILVPQRVDPLSHTADEPAAPRGGTRPDAVPVEGSEAFARRIEEYPAQVREPHQRVLRWARELEHEGIARLWTTVGLSQDVLQVRVPGEQVGMVSIWGWSQGPSMSLWRTVFERRAPRALGGIETMIAPASMGKSVRDLSDALLDALREAYREAASST